MKKMLICAAAVATLLSATAAHSQTVSVLGEFNTLQPQQQQVAIYAMTHYTIKFVQPDGRVLTSLSDSRYAALPQYLGACNIAVISHLRDGLFQTAEQAALGKTRCLQHFSDTRGLGLQVVLTQH